MPEQTNVSGIAPAHPEGRHSGVLAVPDAPGVPRDAQNRSSKRPGDPAATSSAPAPSAISRAAALGRQERLNALTEAVGALSEGYAAAFAAWVQREGDDAVRDDTSASGGFSSARPAAERLRDLEEGLNETEERVLDALAASGFSGGSLGNDAERVTRPGRNRHAGDGTPTGSPASAAPEPGDEILARAARLRGQYLRQGALRVQLDLKRRSAALLERRAARLEELAARSEEPEVWTALAGQLEQAVADHAEAGGWLDDVAAARLTRRLLRAYAIKVFRAAAKRDPKRAEAVWKRGGWAASLSSARSNPLTAADKAGLQKLLDHRLAEARREEKIARDEERDGLVRRIRARLVRALREDAEADGAADLVARLAELDEAGERSAAAFGRALAGLTGARSRLARVRWESFAEQLDVARRLSGELGRAAQAALQEARRVFLADPAGFVAAEAARRLRLAGLPEASENGPAESGTDDTTDGGATEALVRRSLRLQRDLGEDTPRLLPRARAVELARRFAAAGDSRTDVIESRLQLLERINDIFGRHAGRAVGELGLGAPVQAARLLLSGGAAARNDAGLLLRAAGTALGTQPDPEVVRLLSGTSLAGPLLAAASAAPTVPGLARTAREMLAALLVLASGMGPEAVADLAATRFTAVREPGLAALCVPARGVDERELRRRLRRLHRPGTLWVNGPATFEPLLVHPETGRAALRDGEPVLLFLDSPETDVESVGGSDSVPEPDGSRHGRPQQDDARGSGPASAADGGAPTATSANETNGAPPEDAPQHTTNPSKSRTTSEEDDA